jgi:hypothetical protein
LFECIVVVGEVQVEQSTQSDVKRGSTFHQLDGILISEAQKREILTLKTRNKIFNWNFFWNTHKTRKKKEILCDLQGESE